jgi:hypothetical protein
MTIHGSRLPKPWYYLGHIIQAKVEAGRVSYWVYDTLDRPDSGRMKDKFGSSEAAAEFVRTRVEKNNKGG